MPSVSLRNTTRRRPSSTDHKPPIDLALQLARTPADVAHEVARLVGGGLDA